MKTFAQILKENKGIQIHLSGRPSKKEEKEVMKIVKFWDGKYVNATDKGAIFEFGSEGDATGFERDIRNKVKNLFTDRLG